MKVAIVTGASRGLGLATALALAKENFSLALCARERPPTLKVGVAMMRTVDVRRRSMVSRFVKEVHSKWGRIDVLVNNAGCVDKLNRLEYKYPDNFDECIRTNLYGPFNFMRKVVPIMRAQHSGTIINVASKAARYPVPGASTYAASKAALVAMTRVLAKELEGTGVRAINVLPGGMATGMRAHVYGDEDAAKQQSPEFVAGIIRDLVVHEKVGMFGSLVPSTPPPDIVGSWPPITVVPNGADVLVWKNEVRVFPMEELK